MLLNTGNALQLPIKGSEQSNQAHPTRPEVVKVRSKSSRCNFSLTSLTRKGGYYHYASKAAKMHRSIIVHHFILFSRLCLVLKACPPNARGFYITLTFNKFSAFLYAIISNSFSLTIPL